MNEAGSEKPKEIFIEGIPASSGTAVGLAFIYAPQQAVSPAQKIKNSEVSAHLTCFDKGHQKLIKQWEELKEAQKDEASKNILGAQIEIIRDPELMNRIKTLIEKERLNVQQAVRKAFDEYIDFFSKSGSPVTADRMIDLTDIRDQLMEAAGNRSAPVIEKNGDIAVAEELSPREIIALSNRGIKGVIMERGGRTSHAAIIARSIGIPAVTGAAGAAEIITDHAKVCLNGEQGFIYVNPTKATCSQAEKATGADLLNKKEAEKLCAHPSVTADGRSFTLRANIEFAEELAHINRCKAEGVGLLRTEALYLNREQFGGRRTQQSFYEHILESTSEHPVTIRLFDIGGDKFLSDKITESNPFLGWRGIRMLLDERELLREQLTAILAAAGNHPGRVKLLLPMITMLNEVDEVKNEIKTCRKRLTDEGQPIDKKMPLGIMVETPNVALQAADFAKEVDFFSIGTNDLIQYLLAVDRGNARISRLYNQLHPVMWQVIDKTVKAAHKNDIEAEVCGELASYPAAAACLLGMNIDGLSMNPSGILNVKKLLTQRSLTDMQKLAKKTLRCRSLHEIEKLFETWKKEK